MPLVPLPIRSKCGQCHLDGTELDIMDSCVAVSEFLAFVVKALGFQCAFLPTSKVNRATY
jgi:hypothetical protein